MPRCTLMLLLLATATAASTPAQHEPLASQPPLGGSTPRKGSLIVASTSLTQLGRGQLRRRLKDEPPPRAHLNRSPVKTGRIALNILLWWCLNVVFNLANKQCLNSWPHPWALATLHQAIGSMCMMPLYLPLPKAGISEDWTPIREFPRLSLDDLRKLLPVVALLALGHVTSTLAPAYGTVAFSNIVKTAEPLFTCTFSYLLYRRVFPTPVYLSLLLVVSGVALVSTRDVNFSSFSLVAGMISNAAFALYSVRVKGVMSRSLREWTPRATYALLTICSCMLLAPLSCIIELSGAGSSHLASTNLPAAFSGGNLMLLLLFTGLVQYLSNEIAFCTLSMIHPVTYAVANTLKRTIVVGASLVFFGQRLPVSGLVGAVLAMCGALMYSLSMQMN